MPVSSSDEADRACLDEGKGGIGEFTLDIVKDTPQQIVSLCFPGKRERIDPLTLRFRMHDYVPQDRLVLNFYTLI
ncbi:DUF4424 family protein [Pseudoduganella violaceinigra]|uniref:DUF4424 family protein n=1 Tax=Pseudoduganella violaceinigra TaxID=246602 RepID=UPI0009FCE3D9|nr:DUF4424 family protein [Pseudoduganella violaceinigra]